MVYVDEGTLKRLIEENDAFRKAYRSHKEYEKKVAELEKKTHLTSDEELERMRLKKLKLSLKDEMEKIISVHKGSD